MSYREFIIKQIISVFFILIFSCLYVSGTEYTWDNTVANGNWTDPSCWSPNTGYPGQNSSDTAVITGEAVVTVVLDGDITVTSFTTGSKGNNSVTIDTNGHKLNVSDTVYIHQASAAVNGATLNIDGTGSIKTYALDFPNSNNFKYYVNISQNATLSITTTFYGNGGSNTLEFTGNGTLYIPASGANLGWGDCSVTYASTLNKTTIGSPSYYNVTNSQIDNSSGLYSLTFTLERSDGGTQSVTYPVSIYVTKDSVFKLESQVNTVTFTGLNGSYLKTGDLSIKLPSSSQSYSFTLSWTDVNAGYSIVFNTPDKFTTLKTLEYNCSYKVWTGTNNTSWTDASNWDGGTVPANGEYVRIDKRDNGNYPKIPNGAVIGNILINNDAKCEIETGGLVSIKSITCTGSGKFIGDNATVIITGDYTHTASCFFNNVIVNGSVTLDAELTCSLLYVQGDFNCNNKNLNVSNDFIIVGANYNADDPIYPGVDKRYSYYDSYVNAPYLPTVKQGALSSSGATIKVGGNLYVNGTDISDATFELPSSDSSSPVFNSSDCVTKFQWGVPYAVVFNGSVSNVTVNCSSGSAYIIASSNLQAVDDNGSNTNVNFDSPELTGASAVSDSIICLKFADFIENKNDEINNVLNISYASVTDGGIWCNGGKVQIKGDAYVDSACTQSVTGRTGLKEIYIKSSSVKWNTDATGFSCGTIYSSDSSGFHHDITIDLSFMEGLFYAEKGHTMVRGYGFGAYESYKDTGDASGPKIGHSFAMVNNRKIITIFTEPIDASYIDVIVSDCKFVKMSDKSDYTSLNVLSAVFTDKSDTSKVMLTLDNDISFANITDLYLMINLSDGLKDRFGNKAAKDICHAISDFAINAVDVIYAASGDGSDGWSNNYLSRTYDFSHTSDLSERLRCGNDVIIQAMVSSPFRAVLYGAKSKDIPDTALSYGRAWFPGSFCYPSVNGASIGANNLYNYTLRQSVFDFDNGDCFEFIFKITDNAGNDFRINHDDNNETADIPLFAVNVDEVAFNEGNCDSLDIWSINFEAIKHQKGGVSILNNVINVNTREQTTIEVDMPKDGRLSVFVMTLDGNIVKTLVKGTVSSGLHYYHWDGTNNNGKACARGLYFVRVIASGIDETRKVMCVKD